MNSSQVAKVRAQYHFRPSKAGLCAWDVRRLIELTEGLPVRPVPLADIAEIDEDYWFSNGTGKPTCRAIVTHLELVQAADLNFPIILCSKGRVMDGMHRVCRALLDGHQTIAAVQFETDPEPDHVGRDPSDLPYDD